MHVPPARVVLKQQREALLTSTYLANKAAVGKWRGSNVNDQCQGACAWQLSIQESELCRLPLPPPSSLTAAPVTPFLDYFAVSWNAFHPSWHSNV